MNFCFYFYTLLIFSKITTVPKQHKIQSFVWYYIFIFNKKILIFWKYSSGFQRTMAAPYFYFYYCTVFFAQCYFNKELIKILKFGTSFTWFQIKQLLHISIIVLYFLFVFVYQNLVRYVFFCFLFQQYFNKIIAEKFKLEIYTKIKQNLYQIQDVVEIKKGIFLNKTLINQFCLIIVMILEKNNMKQLTYQYYQQI
eukprot:TRINITY_DN20674_c0_g1_i1.p3 TRINITY_DN20674_c0_g1~~TRINITY_DN20674_c0_g1_i1.p3  ORF type:complete len:196 (-),score=-13.80 TRINITY_DN20674_c0_g1_i1:510-1097(-)